jgi:hypothetical protein
VVYSTRDITRFSGARSHSRSHYIVRVEDVSNFTVEIGRGCDDFLLSL